VITATHVIVYAEEPEATRAFFRDVLGFRNVDAGDGWLIFALPPAELGVHPASGPNLTSGQHELYLMCDDIRATLAHLEARGAEVMSPVADEGFGLVTSLRVPGGGQIGLYEPRHPMAADLGD
jgi:catechol 2,3-dioxygenase-like lactoylglutathione lyase family enzyme